MFTLSAFLGTLVYLSPLFILYLIFRLPFQQIKSKLLLIFLITFLVYLLLFYVTFLMFVGDCVASKACYGSTSGNIKEWLGYMGIGWGMLMVPPIFMFLNGLVFAHKRVLGTNLFVRFITGASIAFICWLLGAMILAALGFTLGD